MSSLLLDSSHQSLSTLTLKVDQLWETPQIRSSSPYACISFEWTEKGLYLNWKALFHNNPSPPCPPTTDCWGLWNYEVVELFIVGRQQNYLELEWGPYGHSLALKLKGIRQLESRVQLPFIPLIVQESFEWKGSYLIPFEYLPPPIEGSWQTEFIYQMNAFAIWEDEICRQHAIAFPLQGETPDFHQIEQFPYFKLKVKRT